MVNKVPILELQLNKDLGQRLNRTPLTYDEDTQVYFLNIALEEEVPMGPIPPELVAATALGRTRNLAF